MRTNQTIFTLYFIDQTRPEMGQSTLAARAAQQYMKKPGVGKGICSPYIQSFPAWGTPLAAEGGQGGGRGFFAILGKKGRENWALRGIPAEREAENGSLKRRERHLPFLMKQLICKIVDKRKSGV